jgi:hypothetical protein
MFEIKRAASLAAYGHVFPPSEYPIRTKACETM